MTEGPGDQCFNVPVVAKSFLDKTMFTHDPQGLCSDNHGVIAAYTMIRTVLCSECLLPDAFRCPPPGRLFLVPGVHHVCRFQKLTHMTDDKTCSRCFNHLKTSGRSLVMLAPSLFSHVFALSQETYGPCSELQDGRVPSPCSAMRASMFLAH